MSPITVKPVARRGWRWLGMAFLTGLILLGLYPLLRYFWANSRYQSALTAAEHREFKTARENFDLCIREWPNNAEVRFQAGRAARREGDYEAAGQLLRDAKRLGWAGEAIELEQILALVQQRQHQ